MSCTLEERGFRAKLRSSQGRTLKLLTGPSAAIFRATINRIGAYEPGGELGSDPRGKRIMEIAAAGAPPITAAAQLQDLDNSETYSVTTIGLDCPSYSQKFELLQLTAKDS